MSSAEEQEHNEVKDDPLGLSKLTPPKFFKNSRNRLLDDLARARAKLNRKQFLWNFIQNSFENKWLEIWRSLKNIGNF